MVREFPGPQRHAAEPNAYRILRMVREANRISRVEIADRTGLSKATVSEIAGRLVDSGFLVPVGQGPAGSRGGRKRELLEFNPAAGSVIGVDIERTRTHVAVTDLGANILRRSSFSYPAGSPPKNVLKELVASIRTLGPRTNPFHRSAVGIGIGLPGVIDQESGVVKVADTLKGWEGYNIAQAIRGEFGLPVFVENDVKARTLGELIFGAGRNVRDAVYLWLGDGIGAGLVIDGRLHHGFTSSAGEVGYNNVVHASRFRSDALHPDDARRGVGGLLSEANIAHALGLSPSRSLSSRIVARLRARDKRADQLLKDIGAVVGELCITLVNTLNPEAILLGGDLFWHMAPLVEAVQEKVKRDVLSVPADAVRISVSALKEDGVLLGSVGHVLFDLFRPTQESRRSAAA